jgi:two-component system, chemotaxis family, response regulator Rcp1
MERTFKPIDILLVEDSQTDALIAEEALELSKMINRLFIAEDGVEALDFLHKRGNHADKPRPGLILLDLNLPKKNGIEVLNDIKSDSSLKTIPVVVLTTSKAEEDIVKSYSLYANCYITKPLDFSKFTEVVLSIREFWFSIVTLPPESRGG